MDSLYTRLCMCEITSVAADGALYTVLLYSTVCCAFISTRVVP